MATQAENIASAENYAAQAADKLDALTVVRGNDLPEIQALSAVAAAFAAIAQAQPSA